MLKRALLLVTLSLTVSAAPVESAPEDEGEDGGEPEAT